MIPGTYDVHFAQGHKHKRTVPSTSPSLLIKKRMIGGGYVVFGVRAETFADAKDNALELLLKRT